MRAKPGVTKDTVFSTLCQAGFGTKATGAEVVITTPVCDVKHKQHRYYFIDATQTKWMQINGAHFWLQWYKNGKIPKRKKR
jgi:hypothetical protein